MEGGWGCLSGDLWPRLYKWDNWSQIGILPGKTTELAGMQSLPTSLAQLETVISIQVQCRYHKMSNRIKAVLKSILQSSSTTKEFSKKCSWEDKAAGHKGLAMIAWYAGHTKKCPVHCDLPTMVCRRWGRDRPYGFLRQILSKDTAQMEQELFVLCVLRIPPIKCYGTPLTLSLPIQRKLWQPHMHKPCQSRVSVFCLFHRLPVVKWLL